MKRTTKNEFDRLLEAILASGIEDEGTIEKMLNVHGYEFEKTSKLAGAIDLLGEKYYLGEFKDLKPKPEADKSVGRENLSNISKSESRISGDQSSVRGNQPSIPRRRVMSFINKRTHKARQLRNKRRVQHVRDNLEGQIAAYEDVLRYIKKIK